LAQEKERPAFTSGEPQENRLWINQGWLDKLGLPMPATIEELETTLIAFRDQDPNGNGIPDEIPLSGARLLFYYGYDFIIDAFICNDTGNSRMYTEDGIVKFAPTTEEWRGALKYLRSLNDQGLYYSGSFMQEIITIQQMAANVNDILGAFEGPRLDLVVLTDNQDIIDRYASIPALTRSLGGGYVLPSLEYTPDEIEKISALRINIDAYIEKSVADFVAGDLNPSDDSHWNRYVAEFDRMGLTTYLEIVQTVFARINAAE
jgi:hypothetical protein